ncbi:conserved hypothetical protein [Ralstonia phage RP13]|nr:conserved hypothetical protein [Ralstonia phage RP13]
MKYYSLIRSHFPYKTFNPGQYEAIAFALEQFVDYEEKHVILDLPTGIGKSAVAHTIYKCLQELSNREKYIGTFISPRINLQEQYCNEFSDLVSLTGKTNYECPKFPGTVYNTGDCRESRHSGTCEFFDKGECPYVKARNKWCNKSNGRVTNTSFMIEACDLLINKPHNRSSLITVDECHTLDKLLIDHCTIILDLKSVNYLKKFKFDKLLSRFEECIKLFAKIKIGEPFDLSTHDSFMNKLRTINLVNAAERYRELLEGRLNSDELKDVSNSAVKSKRSVLYQAIEELEQITDKIKLLYSGELTNIIISESSHNRVVIKPVFAREVAWYGLYRKADKFLHISATIVGKNLYCQDMGLPRITPYFSANNPIPVKNRTITIDSTIKVSGNKNHSNLFNGIKKIIDKHGDQPGIIHTVSYNLAEEIVANVNSDRFVVTSDYKEIRGILKSSNKIVVSPAIEEGVDLKESMFQIIAKTPYLFLGDVHVKLNLNTKLWYDRKTMIRVIQMCGRSVRGVNDYADTYVLDNTFINVLDKCMNITPKWFLEGIDIVQ